jgi:hypothetical protein
VAEEARQAPLWVWGLVDRDVFLRECQWEQFYASDHEVVRNGKCFGERVIPLSRWEIEGYIIEPKATEKLRSNVGRHRGQPHRTTETVRAELIAHCHCLIPISAANAYLHEVGQPQLGKKSEDRKFIVGIRQPSDMLAAVRQRLEEVSKARKPKKSFDEHYNCAVNFAPQENDFSADALQRLLCIVDNKLLIHRIISSYGIGDDHTYQLADDVGILEYSERPSDLVDFVCRIVDAFSEWKSKPNPADPRVSVSISTIDAARVESSNLPHAGDLG